MKRIYLVIIFLYFGHIVFAQNVVLTLVYDKETHSSAQEFEKIIKKYFSDVAINKLSYRNARELREKFSFLRLPFGVFNPSLKENDKILFALAFNRIIVPYKDYYIVNPDIFLQWGQEILGRKQIRGRLDIFSMGFCPACRRSEYFLASYLKKHYPGFNLHIRFVGRINKEGKILSLHGAREVEEDIIEKIIEMHFPDKLLDYLIRKKDTLDSQKILASLGIEKEKIKKYYKEAEKMVIDDIKFADSLGINSTPTFLWENVLVVGNFSLVLQLLKNYIGNGKSTRK